MVRYNHNKGIVGINVPLKPTLIDFKLGRLKLVFVLLRWQKEDTRTKKIKMFNFIYKNIDRALLVHVLNMFADCLSVWSSI
jgi:hypothetical protein